MAINNNLEMDLQTYCKTQDSNLFEEKLYLPLKYLASNICVRNKIPSKDIEENIQDMVSLTSVKLPETFDVNKGGTCKALAFVIMSQYLGQQRQYENRIKRSKLNTVWLEDLNSETTCLIEVIYDQLKVMKDTVIQNKHLFASIEHKLNRKIALHIVNAIETPEKYKEYYGSVIPHIAKKSRCDQQQVYAAIKIMRGMLATVI